LILQVVYNQKNKIIISISEWIGEVTLLTLMSRNGYGPKAQLETFLMSNVVPQRPNLNQKMWEQLEEIEIDD
jgi:hypothetical protein